MEDYTDTGARIHLILKECEIIVAGNIGPAFLQATEAKFDLYLLDYHLPDAQAATYVIGYAASAKPHRF